MWALGCILGELLQHEPLFAGRSEAHMLELFGRLLGSANDRIWPEVRSMPMVSLLKGLPNQP
eukprot:7712497-Pyramimonas_sp.AAC.1